jgi:hypothetical protein
MYILTNTDYILNRQQFFTTRKPANRSNLLVVITLDEMGHDVGYIYRSR